MYENHECHECAASLLCLLKQECYWCLHCKGWWIPKSLTFVKCEDFGSPSQTLKRAINLYTIKGGSGFYANYITIHWTKEIVGIYGEYLLEWTYKFERVDNSYFPITLECPLCQKNCHLSITVVAQEDGA